LWSLPGCQTVRTFRPSKFYQVWLTKITVLVDSLV
jgi:hypothetical protein